MAMIPKYVNAVRLRNRKKKNQKNLAAGKIGQMDHERDKIGQMETNNYDSQKVLFSNSIHHTTC